MEIQGDTIVESDADVQTEPTSQSEQAPQAHAEPIAEVPPTQSLVDAVSSVEDVVVEEVVDADSVAEDTVVEPVEDEGAQPQPTEVQVTVNEEPTAEETTVVSETEADVPSVPADIQSERADEVVEAATQEAEETENPWKRLGIHPKLVKAVKKAGYDAPSEVQAKVIPLMLEGRDVIAQSQTGSGKTAAFALPILSSIDMDQRSVRALVLTPTRELAIQVAEAFEKYAVKQKRCEVLAVYGGQDYLPQRRALERGSQVVVGTPGRVIDHIKRGNLKLDDIECLVLDEADEMLNMGFLEDVEFVVAQMPETRQVTMLSATMPGPIRDIADNYLVDPATVRVKRKQMTAESITQRAVIVPPKDKAFVLGKFLEHEPIDGVIVFTKTKDATVRLAEQLGRNGFSAAALNGDMPQKVRERTVEQLKAGNLDILVATDVAARGLDVKRVSHVFNFDFPHDSESYIHRIGRTGRAGREGNAIIFLTPAQRRKLKIIERATKRTIEIVEAPTADMINARRVERLKQQITETAANTDLQLFKELVIDQVKTSELSMETVAAALIHIGQKGRPFLLKERPTKTKEPRERGKDRDFDRPHNRKGEKSFNDSKKQHRKLGPPEPGMTRYRIEVGRNDGVAPRNIVGAVANEAGIESEFIGPIKIYPHFSTVDLPEGMPKDIYRTLQRTWVSGKQLQIRPDRHPDERSERPYKGKGKPKHKKKNAGGKKRFKPKNKRSRD